MFSNRTNLTTGESHLETSITGEPITIHVSKPGNATKNDFLILFDGMKRNAVKISRKAHLLSERHGLIVFAPQMSLEQFPNWRYEHAGVIRKRKLLPASSHTALFIQGLVDFTREVASTRSVRVHLFGHSAGGQLLSRASAYSSLSAVNSIVISNPSSYALPDRDVSVPFGFKDLLTSVCSRQRMREYLASPITIYLGLNDTGSINLSQSKGAVMQGANRLSRGRFVYKTAMQLAVENNWVFNWNLIEVAGVGHSSRAMLEAEECPKALRL